MKALKVVVFSLLLGSTGAYFYAYRRTNGNVFQSIQFALYCLRITLEFCSFSLPDQQHQPTEIVRMPKAPAINSYVSIFDQPSSSLLYMSSFESPVASYYSSYGSQKAINELRAGDSRVTQAAWLLVTIWMLQQQSVGFQPVNHVPLPPHIESARNSLFGKPKSDRLSCREYQYRSQTQLEMARRAPVINMDKEYQNFLLMKHPETECSQERFKALSTDPQRKMIDEYSIKKAIIILEAEGRGIIKGAERPDLDNGEPNIDFKVKGPGNHRYVDVKEPRNFGRGNQDLDSAARRMGHKIYKQKEQSKFGILRNEVLHIVNLELLDPGQRSSYQTNLFSPHGSKDIIIVDITKRS